MTTTTPSLGKAEFIALANAACREQRAGLEQRVVQFERRLKGREPERYGDVVHFVFLPTVEEEINQIEAVGTPRGERERLRVLLSAERSALGALVVQPRVASIAVAERQFNRSGRMLRAYGLGACANGTH